MTDFHAELESRLIRYAAIDSQSNDTSPTSPSTEIQLNILRLLETELKEIGAAEVQLTPYGTVTATLPGTAPGPTIALLAHIDTTPQFNATSVKPRVIRGYNGGAISFPDNPALTLSPDHNPYLGTKQGHDIITASGTTLLGADDKAGVAILMTAARHLLENPDIPHPTLRLAFTPDEEIGRGVHSQLPTDLKADFAYTFDGGAVGEIEYESFSADGAIVHHQRRLDPPRPCQRQTCQRHPSCRQNHPDPAASDADTRNHRRPRRLHPRHRNERRRVGNDAEIHPARF